MRATIFLLCSTILVGSGCARTTVVGVGGEPDHTHGEVRAGRPSLFLGAPDERLLADFAPELGDLDGDGYDDFVLHAHEHEHEADSELGSRSRIYLFYGRPEFPEQLSTADADAVFQTFAFGVSPLGDINGDGRSDFAMVEPKSETIAIVLGRSARLSGRYEGSPTDVIWRGPSVPSTAFDPKFPDDLSPPAMPFLQQISRAGDVNCDGFDDILLLSHSRWVQVDTSTFAGVNDAHLILGRKAIPAGTWDPSWVAAVLATADEDAQHEIGLQTAGDLDGDGCADLQTASESQLRVFYGGSGKLRGRLTKHDADATLHHAAAWLTPLGDLDGDGTTDFVRMPNSPEEPQFQVMYGERARLRGEVQFSPSFVLNYETDDYVLAATGDVSGDGAPDLVIGDDQYAKSATLPAARGAVFAVLGAGTRLVGSYDVTDADLLMLGTHPTAAVISEGYVTPGLGASISIAGDVDGDGANEILGASESAADLGAVFLIPSGPRAPD